MWHKRHVAQPHVFAGSAQPGACQVNWMCKLHSEGAKQASASAGNVKGKSDPNTVCRPCRVSWRFKAWNPKPTLWAGGKPMVLLLLGP